MSFHCCKALIYLISTDLNNVKDMPSLLGQEVEDKSLLRLSALDAGF